MGEVYVREAASFVGHLRSAIQSGFAVAALPKTR